MPTLEAGGLSYENIFTRTVVSTSTYTATVEDYLLGVRTPNQTCTITLPQISTITINSYHQKRYAIVDERGSALTYHIIIIPTPPDLIIGQPEFRLRSNYASVYIYNDGGSTWFIGG